MQPLKYAAHLQRANVQKCPPDTHQSLDYDEVYRWVHSRLDHPHNFLPAALINPPRFQQTIEAGNYPMACAMFGLSFYDTRENSQKKYNHYYQKRFKRKPSIWVRRVGGYVARGIIKSDFGLCDTPNIDGHVCLHEFEAADLMPHFSIDAQFAKDNDIADEN